MATAMPWYVTAPIVAPMTDELKAALPQAWRPAVDSLDPAGVVILHARIPTSTAASPGTEAPS